MCFIIVLLTFSCKYCYATKTYGGLQLEFKFSPSSSGDKKGCCFIMCRGDDGYTGVCDMYDRLARFTGSERLFSILCVSGAFLYVYYY